MTWISVKILLPHIYFISVAAQAFLGRFAPFGAAEAMRHVSRISVTIVVSLPTDEPDVFFSAFLHDLFQPAWSSTLHFSNEASDLPFRGLSFRSLLQGAKAVNNASASWHAVRATPSWLEHIFCTAFQLTQVSHNQLCRGRLSTAVSLTAVGSSKS